ncbi:hypothetical protein [Mycoplasmopsis felis]|uniref:hypothetical protein n=1 Tax=Mycoplasmopsis felis TaxID=33923 RepID=UPI002AFF15DB|nr:hypothetical protein [Mycoplasmopsis felis]WQQ07519.1 hypothetical protein RRG57_02665 [Mycoplasmopsis felis]
MLTYLKHTWLQTSFKKNNTYIFLEEKIVTDLNLNNTINYYEKLIQDIKQTALVSHNINIIIPDIYLYYFNKDMLYSNENHNIENQKMKSLDNLRILINTISEFENVNILYNLKFSSILSISKLIEKYEIINNEKLKEEYHKLKDNNFEEINDLLYTQEFDFNNILESKLELKNQLEKIINELIDLFNISGLLINNISKKIDKIKKQELNDVKHYLFNNLNLTKKSVGINLYIYENKAKNLSYFKEFNFLDGQFYELILGNDFNNNIKKILKIVKTPFIPIISINKLLTNQTKYLYLIDKIRLLINLLSMFPISLGLFFEKDKIESNILHPLYQVNAYEILLKYFYECIEKRTIFYKFNESKKVQIRIINKLWNTKIIKILIKMNDEREVTFLLNISNIDTPELNAFSIKLL